MPRALISVTDKSGVVEFARGLAERGFEIVSTGGTARALRDSGLRVRDVAEVTGLQEMLDGRVKTLHPAIHAGLLADLRLPDHVEALRDAGFEPFDVLCVNLYAFEATVTGKHTFDEAVESIDIGGPAMIRAAAKNHANVLVVVDPADYARVLSALDEIDLAPLRLELAAKAFRHTAYYDSMVARYLSERSGAAAFPETLTLGLRRAEEPLRYGENPHQGAARYFDPLLAAEALRPEGETAKATSYNNWLDADAAWRLAADLGPGACVIVKHGNPCGAAIAPTLGEAYRIAKASDPVSAFGGIVAFNGRLDSSAVEAMAEKGNFLEVIVSREGDDGSARRELLSGPGWRQNVRFLVAPASDLGPGITLVPILGGFLAQDRDSDRGEEGWRVATARQPTPEQWRALRFAWKVVAHVKSNAIVVCKEDRLLGVGAGQMNRVQSVRLAIEQAGDGARGAALASDAFFPFDDSIRTAAAAGIGCVIQPGGSKKDDEVIAAANELGVPMVLTGVRHFRHQ